MVKDSGQRADNTDDEAARGEGCSNCGHHFPAAQFELVGLFQTKPKCSSFRFFCGYFWIKSNPFSSQRAGSSNYLLAINQIPVGYSKQQQQQGFFYWFMRRLLLLAREILQERSYGEISDFVVVVERMKQQQERD